MFYQNKHWISLDGVDVISEDWAFFCLWYSKRMLERQAGLCKLSCFGFVNGVAHYEVYHWAKNHYEHHQELKEIVYKSEIEEQIKERLRDADKTCKTVVSWGRQYYFEVYHWTKRHFIEQRHKKIEHESDMKEFFTEKIIEREHEKEYLCCGSLVEFQYWLKFKNLMDKHIQKQNLLSRRSLSSLPSDKIGDV